MSKFMCTHTVPPGKVTREQANEIAAASQKDPNIKGYRSFLNLTEGKIFCVCEAPDEHTLAAWYEKMEMPYDAIWPLEFEGYLGKITDVAPVREHTLV